MASIPVVVLLVLLAYRAPALSGSGITDPDYYWHVAYGEWILRQGTLPTTDLWSWTFAGHEYRLTQWLGEVFMGLANQAAGTLGTSALAALLVTLAIAASYRAARHCLDNRLAALAVAIGCNAMLVSLACRPHQFTHLGLALLTWIVAAYQAGNRRALWGLPPLFAAWVNFHGGYAFGLFYLGAVAACLAAESYMQRDIARIRHFVMPLVGFSVLALLATLLNPYGWGAWRYAVEIASLQSSSAGIVEEWAATSVKTEVGLNYFAVTASMFACMALSSKRPPVSNVLLALVLVAIGWSAVRLSLMATVLMVPLLAAALRGTAFYSLAFDGASRRYDRTVGLGTALAIVVGTAAASTGIAMVDKTTERHVAAKMPVAEGQFIEAHALGGGKVLNPPEIGGYLIRKHGLRVSLDTRLDLYGDRALFEWLFASRGADGWRDYIARHDPDLVIIGNPATLRSLLTESGLYRPVFEGPSYTVLVRQNDFPALPTVALTPPSAKILSLLQS